MIRREAPSLLLATPFIPLAAAAPALAREPAIDAQAGLAIGGVDPVAYRDAGAPGAGSPKHALGRGGATWRFASAPCAARFAADPEGHAPRCGGYCAWAVSQGHLAPIDPDAWTLREGRLDLNATLGIRRRWVRDVEGHVARADAHWPRVLG